MYTDKEEGISDYLGGYEHYLPRGKIRELIAYAK
jgi:hypothetical protein